jgi:DNA-directed RNA polymerase specialized sigma24 family protein
MSQRKEYPFDPLKYNWEHKRSRLLGSKSVLFQHRPLDELEMLMREAPGTVSQDVPLSRTAALKDVLGEAVDALPPQERFIAEQLFIAGSSLRKTGAALGIPKTTLARRRDTIRRHLMAELVDKPSVRRWLRGD